MGVGGTRQARVTGANRQLDHAERSLNVLPVFDQRLGRCLTERLIAD